MKIKTTTLMLTRGLQEMSIKMCLGNCSDASHCEGKWKNKKLWQNEVLKMLAEEKIIHETLTQHGHPDSMKYYQKIEDRVNESRKEFNW